MFGPAAGGPLEAGVQGVQPAEQRLERRRTARGSPASAGGLDRRNSATLSTSAAATGSGNPATPAISSVVAATRFSRRPRPTAASLPISSGSRPGTCPSSDSTISCSRRDRASPSGSRANTAGPALRQRLVGGQHRLARLAGQRAGAAGSRRRQVQGGRQGVQQRGQIGGRGRLGHRRGRLPLGRGRRLGRGPPPRLEGPPRRPAPPHGGRGSAGGVSRAIRSRSACRTGRTSGSQRGCAVPQRTSASGRAAARRCAPATARDGGTSGAGRAGGRQRRRGGRGGPRSDLHHTGVLGAPDRQALVGALGALRVLVQRQGAVPGPAPPLARKRRQRRFPPPLPASTDVKGCSFEGCGAAGIFRALANGTFGQVAVTVKRLLGADHRWKYSRWRKRNRPKSQSTNSRKRNGTGAAGHTEQR